MTWEEAQQLAVDRGAWRRSVAQYVFDTVELSSACWRYTMLAVQHRKVTKYECWCVCGIMQQSKCNGLQIISLYKNVKIIRISTRSLFTLSSRQ